MAWLRQARESQLAQYEMANMLKKKGERLSSLIALLTSVIGAGAFLSVAVELIPIWSKILAGMLSVVAAVLASLQTLHDYSGQGDKHRVFGARFGAVRRELEEVYALRLDGIDPQLVDKIRQERDVLAREAPNVPPEVYQRIQEQLSGG